MAGSGEIAELDVVIDATSAAAATKILANLTTSAVNAEGATLRLGNASQLTGTALMHAAAAARAMAAGAQGAAQAQYQLTGATAGYGAAATQLRGLNAILGTTASGLHGAAGGVTNLGATLRHNIPYVDDLTKRLSGLAFGAAGLAMLRDQMAQAVTAALEFSTNMAAVSTVLPDSQQGELPRLTQTVKDLALAFGSPAPAQAKALYDIIAAGAQDAAQATDILTTSNKLAVGGITTVGKAADGLTSVMANWGSTLSEATEAADAMFIAAAAGKTSIEQIARHVAVVAPMAAQMGVSFDELMAATGALTKGGMQTEMAMHGLRAVLGAVSKPSKQAAVLAEELGIEYSTAGLKARGFAGFLEHLKDKTGGSIEDMAVLLNGVEALTPVMALTGEGAAAFANTLDQMSTKAGATERAFAKMAATPQFQIDLLKAKFEELQLSIGDDFLRGIAGSVKWLNDNFHGVVSTIGTVVQAFGTLLAMRAGGWTQQWVTGLLAQRAAAAAAQQAMINTALANANYTRYAGQSNVAALQSALALLRQREAALQLALALQGPLAGGHTTSALAATRNSIAQTQGALSMASAGVASRALGAAMTFAGGPVGVLIGAVSLLYAAYSYLEGNTEEARLATEKWASAAGTAASRSRQLVEQMAKEQGILKDATRSQREHADATVALEATRSRLLALGPEFRDALGQESKSWEAIAEAIEKVNRASLSKVQAEISKVKRDIEAVKPSLGSQIRVWDKKGDFSIWNSVDDTSARQAMSVAEQRAPLQDHLNKLLEEEANILESMTPIQEKHVETAKQAADATGLHGKQLLAHAKEADKAAAALERFVKGLEEQARMSGKGRGDSIREKDEYLQLNGALKERADIAIDVIEAAKREAEAQREAEAVAKRYAEQVASLNMQLGVEHEDKFAKAQVLLGEELTRNNITLAEYNERIAKAAELWTEEGRARVKHEQELDQYLKRSDPGDEAARKLGLLNELYATGRIGLKAYGDEAVKLHRVMSKGFDTVMEAAESAAKTIADSLVEFAITGKLAFKDMVASILQDLARMMAQKAITELLGMLISSAASAWVGGPSAPTPVSYNAGGGFAHASKALVVGEKGPELFVPRQNGTIVPSARESGPVSINVEVHVAANGSTSVSESPGDAKGDMQRHGRALTSAVVKVIQGELLPGGSLYHLQRG